MPSHTRKNRQNMRRANTRRNNMNMQMGGGNMISTGSKAQVYHGTAKHTAGGLTKSDLVMNKRGRIVSRKQMAAGKKAIKRLVAAGYKAKKGTFKLFHK